MSKVLYRYDIEYKSWDSDTAIHLRELPVIRETEKTFIISRYGYGSNERRILKDAVNTYAYDNKQDAKDHFIRRNNKRIGWLNFWKEEITKALELIKEEA